MICLKKAESPGDDRVEQAEQNGEDLPEHLALGDENERGRTHEGGGECEPVRAPNEKEGERHCRERKDPEQDFKLGEQAKGVVFHAEIPPKKKKHPTFPHLLTA